MTIREKIENNLPLSIGAFVIAGFIAGYTAYSAILSTANLETVQKGTYITVKEIDQTYVSKDRFNELLQENRGLQRNYAVQNAKGVELVTFTLNEEESYFQAVSPSDYYPGEEIFGGPFYEPTPKYDKKISNIDKIKEESLFDKMYPVFDTTFLNHSDAEIVLNAVEIAILDYRVPQGDGAEGPDASILNVTHRYLLDIVKIAQKQKRAGNFVRENLSPPIRIPSGKPARVQFGLYSSAMTPWGEPDSSSKSKIVVGSEQEIRLRLTFHFSGGLSVNSDIFQIKL